MEEKIPTDNQRGYLYVDLYNSGKRKRFYVHRLVAQYFKRMLNERKKRGLSAESWHTGVDVFHWWMEDGVLLGQLDMEDIETEGAE
mgnify:CR=1 FL=1